MVAQLKSTVRFEFDNYANENFNCTELEEFLNIVWHNNKLLFSDEVVNADDEVDSVDTQQYLNFKLNEYKPRNYIGFIYFDNKMIEIYPKVFNHGYSEIYYKEKYLNNILFWLKYFKPFKLNTNQTNLDFHDFENFLEFFLYLVSLQIYEIINDQPYHQFQEVEEALFSPKGRIDFNKYINTRIVKGNWHIIDCIYEPFIYDNTLNQVIKYVVRLIGSVAKHRLTKMKVNEILSILEEVTDRICTVLDIDSIRLNPMLNDYDDILTYCRMIIEQQTYGNQSFEINQLAFLIPMEKVFEDFVAGVFEENNYKVETQKSDLYLAKTNNVNVFQLMHDIYFREKKTIIDTKYKIRKDMLDKKGGVSQQDMYQMVGYAIRRECRNISLVYPQKEGQNNANKSLFEVTDMFDNSGTPITITALDIPIIIDESHSESQVINNILDILIDHRNK